MLDSVRGAAGVTKVIPALFKRLDSLLDGIADLGRTTGDMREDVGHLRRETGELLADIQKDTLAIRGDLAAMGERVQSLDLRLAEMEDAIAALGGLAGRLTRRGRRARREGSADEVAERGPTDAPSE